MNKLTKSFLILPIIALSTIGCGEAKPRIESFYGQTVNCTYNLILDVRTQKWLSRSESVDDPSYREIQLAAFDELISQACGS